MEVKKLKKSQISSNGKRKHAFSLRSIFFGFIIKLIVSVILAIMLWLILTVCIINSSSLEPENHGEARIYQLMGEYETADIIPIDKIPSNIKYAAFNNEKHLTDTNLTGDNLELARQLEFSDKIAYSMVNGIDNYKKFTLRDATYIFFYQMEGVYKNKVAQFWADYLVWVSFLWMIFSAVIIETLWFASKMRKQVKKMQETAVLIDKENLDFEIQNTGVKEFDEVMHSLDLLKNNLKQSLKDQWRMQQQRKKQLSALAHDIKTPLTVISGNTELLYETDMTDEQKSYLEYMGRNTEYIKNYVTQMIEITKGEEITANCEKVPLTDIIDTITTDTKALCIQHELSYSIHISDEIKNSLQSIDVTTDLSLLGRIFMNLLDNAVQYSPSMGTIHWSIMCDQSPKRKYTIAVYDEGSGFSKTGLLHAKEEFYRDDESRNGHSHYGMGLYIVGQLADVCGLSLKISNNPETHGAMIEIGGLC